MEVCWSDSAIYNRPRQQLKHSGGAFNRMLFDREHWKAHLEKRIAYATWSRNRARRPDPGASLLEATWTSFWTEIEQDDGWYEEVRYRIPWLAHRKINMALWKEIIDQICEVLTDYSEYSDYQARIEDLKLRLGRDPDSIEAIRALWAQPPPAAKKEQGDFLELKYLSNEGGTSPLIAGSVPRDSIEPRTVGTIRYSDERHHGVLRTTDELVHSIGQLRHSDSPFVKQEAVQCEKFITFYRASEIE